MIANGHEISPLSILNAKPKKFLGVGIKDGYTVVNILAMILTPFFVNFLTTDMLANTVDLLEN